MLVTVLALVVISMAAQDALGTWMVIAEAKGHGWLAGLFDALSDGARIVCTAYGAGQIILHGWTGRSVLILAVMCVTSFFGTALWTHVGHKIVRDRPLVDSLSSLECDYGSQAQHPTSSLPVAVQGPSDRPRPEPSTGHEVA